MVGIVRTDEILCAMAERGVPAHVLESPRAVAISCPAGFAIRLTDDPVWHWSVPASASGRRAGSFRSVGGVHAFLRSVRPAAPRPRSQLALFTLAGFAPIAAKLCELLRLPEG